MAERPRAQAPPPALAPPPGHPRFPLFDSLRAIAALGVVAFHAGVAMQVTSRGASGPLVQHLDAGVTLFFLISGFLLYRPYAAARLTGRPVPRLGDFLRNRALRIVPAYWFALTLASVIVPYAIWGDFWVFYGFAQVYSMENLNQGLFPAWTLAGEVVFYALLPVYAAAMARLASRAGSPDRALRTELIVLGALALASVVVRALVFSQGLGGYERNENWSKTFFTTFDWFAVGMALALASVTAERRGRPPRLLSPLANHPLLAWLGAAVVFVAVADPIRLLLTGGNPVAAELLQHFGYAAIAALLLVPAVFEGDGSGLPRRVLAWPWLAWLGLVSLPRSPYLLFTAVTVAFTVAAAAVSYYLVERPALRFKHGRPRRPGEPVAPARAAA